MFPSLKTYKKVRLLNREKWASGHRIEIKPITLGIRSLLSQKKM